MRRGAIGTIPNNKGKSTKENWLIPNKYLNYLLEQLLQLEELKNSETLDRLLPWSVSLSLTCRVI